MKANKKILTLGALNLLPISILPLTAISCSSGEITYFESESFKISSDGGMWGFYKEDFKHFGPLTIKEKYKGVTIKYISTIAFKDQTNITSISLPKTLVEIGRFAFDDIESPVSFPSDHNFEVPLEWNLSHLTNLEVIDVQAFAASEVVKKPKLALNLSGANKLREIRENAFRSRRISSLSLPNSITTIEASAFSNNQLTSLTLPNSITTIGDEAFSSNQLTSLTLPNLITTIGKYAFSNNQLTSLILPNLITTIGDYSFSNNQLTSLTLPNSNTTIGDYSFSENQLTSLTIPNSITTIGKGAFYNNQLTSLTIPNSITTIGEGAFNSNQLTSLTVPNSITTIEASAFSNNQLTSLTLPNSITTIGDYSFSENQLTSLTLPNSVTTIGDNAFANNAFTPTSKIVLPTQFDNDDQRKRIGLPPKTPASTSLETDFIPLTIENRVKGKLK